ncbi:hypothetical protein D3C75_447580 [compost metagenome]
MGQHQRKRLFVGSHQFNKADRIALQRKVQSHLAILFLHRIRNQRQGIVMGVLDIAVCLIGQITFDMHVFPCKARGQMVHIDLHIEGLRAVQLRIPHHHRHLVIAVAGSHHPDAGGFLASTLRGKQGIPEPGLHPQRMEKRCKAGMAQIIVHHDIIVGAVSAEAVYGHRGGTGDVMPLDGDFFDSGGVGSQINPQGNLGLHSHYGIPSVPEGIVAIVCNRSGGFICSGGIACAYTSRSNRDQCARLVVQFDFLDAEKGFASVVGHRLTLGGFAYTLNVQILSRGRPVNGIFLKA